jgi:long-chain acyl-CoA synthetase
MGRLRFGKPYIGDLTERRQLARGGAAGAAIEESPLGRAGRAVAHFPDYATPRKVWLTLEPWTIAAALMTPTLKRQAIEGAFAKEIAGLYAK